MALGEINGASGQRADASSSTAVSAPALPEDDRFFSSLGTASATVRAFLQEDARWLDLADHLSAAQYQYKLQLVSPWAPLEKRRMLSIPDAVIEASSSAETFAAQGLFPEIDRAWIVIDSRLYLWNYLDGSNAAFESYEHPERVIQSVGLVRPKPGVFVDQIQHVLVVCTSTSITLLGLAFEAPASASASSSSSPAKRELKLFVTDMNLATEGVQMSDVCGTQGGRVFCKGSDGCLYEILYQANEGWFSHRCSLRNVTSPKLSNLVPNFIQGKQKGEWASWAKGKVEEADLTALITQSRSTMSRSTRHETPCTRSTRRQKSRCTTCPRRTRPRRRTASPEQRTSAGMPT